MRQSRYPQHSHHVVNPSWWSLHFLKSWHCYCQFWHLLHNRITKAKSQKFKILPNIWEINKASIQSFKIHKWDHYCKVSFQQQREGIKTVNARTLRFQQEKKQVQGSFFISFIELIILSPNLERPSWITLNNHRTLISPIFQARMYANSFDLYRQGKNGLLTLLDVPFSFLLLQWMTYFLSIGQEKSFALAHLTINFLTREIYFPGNGKGQCILRKPWKIGHSLNNPCLSLSSL